MTSPNWPPEFQAYGVTFKPISAEDLEMVRQWRNDPTIASLMLDKTAITASMQQQWFAGLTGDQNRAYWVVYFKQQPIGVASLSQIDRASRSAEPGMYIYPAQYRNNIVPFCVAFALNDFAFNQLALTTLLGKIYPSNEASVRFHLKCGYELDPARQQSNAELDYYQLTPARYLAARAPIAHFIRY